MSHDQSAPIRPGPLYPHRRQALDEAVLFYTSVLVLEASAAVDVAGPTGLVRSQVMRTSNGSIRVPRRRPARLGELRTAPHVAFSTDRILDGPLLIVTPTGRRPHPPQELDAAVQRLEWVSNCQRELAVGSVKSVGERTGASRWLGLAQAVEVWRWRLWIGARRPR
jgi:hypothetical protein